MNYRSLAKRVGNAVRLAEVVQVLLRHGFADVLRRLGLYEGIPAKILGGMRVIRHEDDRPRSAGERLRAALTELGPTFVKLGQVLSTRPDLVGTEISEALSALQDRVPAAPFDAIRTVVAETFGRPVEELYAEFNSEPVAAGSISQVYRARMQNGTEVAVKVRRPGVTAVVEADLSLLRTAADWMADHVHDLPWLDPRGTIQEFARTVRRELDFNIEAQIIERFAANFKGHPHVVTPLVYRELSAAAVLTMDWVDGARVDALDEYAARNSDPRVVAQIGAEALCRQVFEFRLFHADPHPGNIFITRDNRITFLDYGMAGNLERRDVTAMAELLRALFRDDAADAARALLLFTTTTDLENWEGFRHELAEFMAFEGTAVLSGGQVRAAFERIMTILRRHGLQLAPRFSLMLKALGTIESTAHALDPQIDLLPVIRPFAEKTAMLRYSPEAIWRETSSGLESWARAAAGAPEEALQLLHQLRRGRLKVQLQHEKLVQLAHVLDRASNRIAFGVITGSVIVGSSLLLAANVGLRWLGLAGYTIAGVFGLGLLISIVRSRNY